jgi:hypothetical protein
VANVNEVTPGAVLDDVPPVGGKPWPKWHKPEWRQGDRGHDAQSVRQLPRALGSMPVLAERNTGQGSGPGVFRWFVERTISWRHAFGQAAGLATGPRVAGAGRQAASGPPGQEAGEGGAAGVVGVEHLGEEDPEGDQGGEQALAEGDALVVEGLLPLGWGQQVGAGQAGSLGEVVAQTAGLAGAGGGGGMSRGWPPWR